MDKIIVGITMGSYSIASGSTRDIALNGIPAITENNIAYLYNKTQDKLYYAPVVGLAKATVNSSGNTITIDPTYPVLSSGDSMHIQLYQSVLAYDPSLDAMKYINLTKPTTFDSESLVDTTNVAAATNYYPSSDGFILYGKQPRIHVHLITGTNNDLTFSLETSDELDGVTAVKWQSILIPPITAADPTNTTSLPNMGQGGLSSVYLNFSNSWKVTIDLNDYIGKQLRIKLITGNTGTATNTVYFTLHQMPFEG